MGKINYTNKTTLNPQPSIADENKVTSGDMNEIKSVVNGNFTNNSVTVGDTTPTGDNITATWIKASGNIFDSSNANILNALLRTSGDLHASASERTLYIPCKPNTTYKITKNAGARFRIDERSSTPALESSNVNLIYNDSASMLTYTTSSNGNYLVVNYFTTSESGTEQDMLNSISITVLPSINVLENNEYNEIYTKDIYSLNEVKTNKVWIDGKPIYRKIVEYSNTSTIGANNSSTEIQIAHNISNFNFCTETTLIRPSQYLMFPQANGSTNVNKWTGIAYVNATNIIMRIVNDTWSANTWYIILEYTKTTD